jgi:hypothetical protein
VGEFHIWLKKKVAGKHDEAVKEAVNDAAWKILYI